MMGTPLRCFCSRKPMLGMVLRDETGRPYVHVKVYKQGRIFGEMVCTKGEVYIKCRECHRWHRIKVETVDVAFKPEELPPGYELVS